MSQQQHARAAAQARVPPAVVSSSANAMYKERHIDGFKEDLKSVENNVNEIYASVSDIKQQLGMVYMSPAELRNRLIRTVDYLMWCVNCAITKSIRHLKEIESYVALGLVEADDLDEDDPLLRARKMDHLHVAMRLASVIVAYGRMVVQNSDCRDGVQTLTKLSRHYDKLTFIVAHYQRFGGSGYGRDDGDAESVDEIHRPQLMDARAAVVTADKDCHRLIVDECLTEMMELTVGCEFIYRRSGLLRKWRARVATVGRCMMKLMREDL